jgi:hypothetical protein
MRKWAQGSTRSGRGWGEPGTTEQRSVTTALEQGKECDREQKLAGSGRS